MTTLHVISNPESFWEAARYQRVCAICDRAHGTPDFRGRTFHAHHVISRQLLRRLGLPQWDTRGALRLCTDCHHNAEHGGVGKIVIPVAKLTGDNVCYCWQVLGVAVAQIEGLYGSFDLDPRWHLHHLGECGSCQL